MTRHLGAAGADRDRDRGRDREGRLYQLGQVSSVGPACEYLWWVNRPTNLTVRVNEKQQYWTPRGAMGGRRPMGKHGVCTALRKLPEHD